MSAATAPRQAQFAAALFEPAQATPPGCCAWNGSSPDRRFAVHRNNVVVSLTGALADTFPVARELVGPTFFDAMAGVYVRSHPPTSPVLVRYGERFADWLEDFEPASHLPYLPDMARLEQARLAACHAADALPLSSDVVAALLVDVQALPGLCLQLHPSCRVLRSRFAVPALWYAHQHDGHEREIDIDLQQPSAALVIRDPRDEVLVVEMACAAASFVSALMEGRVLAAALACAPGVDLVAAFTMLLHHGAIVGCRSDGNRSDT